MKNFLYLLIVGAISYSCQKVIDVDLNEANPNIVLEANYTAEDSTVRLRITMTSNFFNTDPSPSVDNAIVSIINQNGVEQLLNSIGDGNFEITNYVPIFNSTYTMRVIHDGVTYDAQCDMNSPVDLEDITYVNYPGFFGLEGGYGIFMNYQDPAGVVNFYQAVVTKNGDEWNKLSDFILQDDQFSDGNYIERPLFFSEFFDTNDVVSLEFRSIDEDIYHYYSEAISIVGAGQAAAAPANPTSNWNNKALGYFSAYSNKRKTVTIIP